MNIKDYAFESEKRIKKAEMATNKASSKISR